MSEHASHLGLAGGTPGCDSYVRTYVRTENGTTTSQMDQDLRNARAGVGGDEWIRVGEMLPGILEQHLATVGQRHEVIRRGERDEIPTHVRAAIWYRDGGRCKECGATSDGAMHLDHITPWSAGGSDITDNLRILCEPCNMRRSNFIDAARPARPATWWCLNCYDRDGYGWDYANGYALTCSVHGSRPWECRVTGRSGGSIKRPPVAVKWHEREPMIAANATTLAYCAHCDAPGMTDQPL